MPQIIKPSWELFGRLVTEAKRELVICAPWISSAGLQRLQHLLLDELTGRSLTRVQLWARIADINTDSPGILELARRLAAVGVSTVVRDSPVLHAKIYLSDRSLALVTSANLSEGGFSSNIEAAVVISEPEGIGQVLRLLEEIQAATTQVSLSDLEEFITKQWPLIEAQAPPVPPPAIVPVWRLPVPSVSPGTGLSRSLSLFELIESLKASLQAAQDDIQHVDLNDWVGKKVRESDPSLTVHFDFENVAPSSWQLRNLGKSVMDVTDGAIVGCQRREGRWSEKGALEFQTVSDRVRLTVPGEFQALTLTAWVCVKGLDRKINSLFMSDGFEPGTVHWVVRRDGVLGLTVIGTRPGDYQIVTSPPVISLDEFGTWMQLAVVLDGQRATHYVNGFPVLESALKIGPPYRVGAAELGNWNAKGFPEKDPFMVRNFSGAMDEFCLFSRALSNREIRSLYSQGRPQPEAISQN